jgi:hypothetical protein
MTRKSLWLKLIERTNYKPVQKKTAQVNDTQKYVA